jgi:hypothetical protein
VDFIAANIYPAWDWSRADANNQPMGVTPESGFNGFLATYHNMFDDQFGVDTSSPFNYHFGLIDCTGASKGILF